jgi:SAM-dependent methyltransferase
MKLGPEVARSHEWRIYSGFYDRYMSGSGVDVGYRGEVEDAGPVLPGALGVDLDTPGYDGVRLPVPYGTLDYVFSSHCLEHLLQPDVNFREWFSCLRVGGFLVVIVPHMYLYEKRLLLPSRWNEGHVNFYTPGKLLTFVESVLEANSYRVEHLRDNDVGFNYALGPDVHSSGAYEIELVLRKIKKPEWELSP